MKEVERDERRNARAAKAARLAAARKARKKAEKIRQQREDAARRLAEERQHAAWRAARAAGEPFTEPAIVISSRTIALTMLGLTPEQDNPVAIRSAYRRLVLKYHPDKNPDKDTTDVFRSIQTAYEIIDPSIGDTD